MRDMENTHSPPNKATVALLLPSLLPSLLPLLLTACHGAEPIIPPEPDPAAWAARAVGDAGGDVSYTDRGIDDDPDASGSDAAISGLCSGQGPATTWEITNRRATPVTLWWVDFACAEQRYSDVAPGQTISQGTFATHVWRVRDTADNRLLVEVVLVAQPTQSTEVN